MIDFCTFCGCRHETPVFEIGGQRIGVCPDVPDDVIVALDPKDQNLRRIIMSYDPSDPLDRKIAQEENLEMPPYQYAGQGPVGLPHLISDPLYTRTGAAAIINGTATAQASPPVARLLEEIQQRQQVLDEAIGKLCQKLEPVSCEVHAKESEDRAPRPHIGDSTLVRALSSISLTVEQQTSRLHEATGRLEI
jgi:hypothetical protein